MEGQDQISGHQQSRQPSPQPSAPGREEMDRIRARRLQMLGRPSIDSQGSSSASSPAPAASASSTLPSAPALTPDLEPALVNSPVSSINNILVQPPKRASSATVDPRNPKSSPASRKAPESLDDFADASLARIFRISVNPDKTQDLHGHRLRFLASSSSELQESAPLKLSIDNLDQYLFEVGQNLPPQQSLFEYMLSCYKRASDMAGSLYRSPPEKQALVKEAKRLAVSHCIFALTLPDLYDKETAESLMPYLLRPFGTEYAIPFDLMGEFVSRHEEDEAILPLLVKSMVDMSSHLAKKNLSTRDHSGYFGAMMMYAKFPILLEALSVHPSFNAAFEPQDIEKKSFLGPFFRLSPLHYDDALIYYPNPTELAQIDRQTVPGHESVRADLDALWGQQYEIVNAFVRAGEKSRSRILSWFAYIMNKNHKRSATYPDKKTLSTDGFMLNVSVILDRLCEPFMDSTFSKAHRIETEYFRRNPRVETSDETKLCADEQTAKEFYKETLSGNNNFISEIFFLSLAGHYYGAEPLHNTAKNLDHEVRVYTGELERMERMLPDAPLHVRPRIEDALSMFRKRVQKYAAIRLAIGSVMANEHMQTLSLRFMRYVAVWLLRLASGTDYLPGKDMKLPLPEQAPASFTCLPEYAASVILNNLRTAFERVPQLCVSSFGDEMFIFCITFLQAKGYIKNPQIKTNLVHVLRMGTVPMFHRTKGIWGDLLMSHKFSQRFLLQSLMDFYIESETTISFYDKFNVRHLIFEVIKAVWPNDEYKRQLSRESKQNRIFFVQFVKLVLNDATYVLDEALSRFPKIHELEVELKTSATMTTEDREKKEKSLKSLESQAHGYMQLTNSIMYMMELFTAAMRDAFLMPEIVERLAAMLDYNIQVLTGSKSKNLKTDNMQKYEFNPRMLVAQFADVYLNLGSSPVFIEAVANDGRSYSPETMAAATHILEKIAAKTPEQMQQWYQLTAKFKEAREAAEQAEVDLGEIPSEFEDPLLSHLMKDPVILPSKIVVDRQTIAEHLLSQAIDPFTRQPMTIDDVIPNTDLRERIEKWKSERIAEARSKIVASKAAEVNTDVALQSETMDTD